MKREAVTGRTRKAHTPHKPWKTGCTWSLFALMLLGLPAALHAQSSPFTYITDSGTVIITGYTGPGGAVTIPSTINGLPVTRIAGYAFENCLTLTSVTIPYGVTSIGTEAFFGCENLSSVSLPDGLTELGERALGHCGGLLNLALPNSLTSIGNYAFQRLTNLTSVVLPNNLTSLGEQAFYRCTKLTRMTIPASVSSLGPSPFGYCTNLLAVTVDPLNPYYSSVDGVLFDKSHSRIIQYPGGKRGHYTVPAGVATIGASSFSFCYRLTSVTMPSSVTSVELEAFQSCADDTTPVLTNLMVVWFQGNAPGLADPVFDGTPNLTIYYTPGTQNWGDYFGGRPTATWSSSVPYAWSANNSTVTIQRDIGIGGDVVIPSSINGMPVTSIADGAFSGFPSLTSVTIPNTITSIGDWAFAACTNLSAINVNSQNPAYSSVDGVLFNKSQTTLVQYPAGKAGVYIIPSSVTSIGNWAFAECANLTNLVLPNSLTSIGTLSFENCTKLPRISIPGSVSRIGNDAFYGCISLTAVNFQGNAPLMGLDVFDVAPSATAYYLPGTANWGSTVGGIPALLWNPTIQRTGSSFGVRTNRFGFTITGTANIPIVVEACNSLVNPTWSPMQVCTLTNGSIYFSDPGWTQYPLRLYRLRSP